MNKRDFLKLTAATGLTLGAARAIGDTRTDTALKDMTTGARPITAAERRARIARAQALMGEHDLDAILIEAGSALTYFTGVRWWRSERFTGVVIARQGHPVIVTPYFEEPSIRESLEIEADVRTWHENEDPFVRMREALNDRGVKTGRLGIEETARYFIVDGLRKAAPSFALESANAITRGCRMYKSAAELALMQRASDITMAAYRHIHPRVEVGMVSADIKQMMNEATRALGGTPKFSMALLNEASAYPHGTRQAQTVREGSVILMDCGCELHDYESDISRTWVYGEPSPKQRKVWATVKHGQEIALETARVGLPAGKVDDAVRAYYTREGFGPGYRTPGLSHRLGHGIGMDGHEPVNFVQGETTPLAPGMCFSNEPGIYLFGEFGVRLEDCLHMTEDGPQLFSGLSPSLDDPIG